MQDIAVMGVSSVQVVGAKMALYVGATDTWLKNIKIDDKIPNFSCMLLFFTVYQQKTPVLLLPPVDLTRP